MRDHGYDLRAYVAKNWMTLGPKLVDKVHVNVGDMDNYYLNMGVYDLAAFFDSSTSPRQSRLPVWPAKWGTDGSMHPRRRSCAMRARSRGMRRQASSPTRGNIKTLLSRPLRWRTM